jgi:hypothetical protein
MTIAVAWIRTIRDCEELLFVTDSRLSGDGRTFDACPKVITLPRGDCAIAFAGYSGHAFPMMQQLAHAITAHGPLNRGAMDISAVRTHTIKIFDSMSRLIASSVHISSTTDTAPEAEFIFGGYSWISKRFELWSFKHDINANRFIARPPKCVRRVEYNSRLHFSQRLDGAGERLAGNIVVTGDQAPVAEKLLIQKLRAKPHCDRLDMEPFEVVRDMLRDQRHSETIGGAPQLVKVYQYMKSSLFGVYWPDRNGTIHLQGRPCLGYERIDQWVIDPDSTRSEPPHYASREAEADPSLPVTD